MHDWKPIIQLNCTTDMVVWAAIWYAVRMRYGKPHACDTSHFQVLLHVAQTGWLPLPLELAHSSHAYLVSLYSQACPSHSRPIGSYVYALWQKLDMWVLSRPSYCSKWFNNDRFYLTHWSTRQNILQVLKSWSHNLTHACGFVLWELMYTQWLL